MRIRRMKREMKARNNEGKIGKEFLSLSRLFPTSFKTLASVEKALNTGNVVAFLSTLLMMVEIEICMADSSSGSVIS